LAPELLFNHFIQKSIIMKNSILIIGIMLLGLSAQAQMDQFFAKIDGMGCAYCANGIERAFKDLKDKKQFKIDLQAGTMEFSYASTAGLTADDILKRVDKAGYTVVEIKIQRADGTNVVWQAETKAAKGDGKNFTEAIVSVLGNCGMCKTRIENAVNELDGIFFAFWDADTQKLHVRFDKSKTSLDDIELELASVGHDTERFKADADVYNNLHHCCKYDRNPKQ
jgi:mercuric ion binding protein